MMSPRCGPPMDTITMECADIDIEEAVVEAISKADVLKGLRSATRQAETKGSYSKSRHAFEILALIDPTLVRRASRYAGRLLDVLANPEDVC